MQKSGQITNYWIIPNLPQVSCMTNLKHWKHARKNLKIPKAQPETVNQRRKNNSTTKGKQTKKQK